MPYARGRDQVPIPSARFASPAATMDLNCELNEQEPRIPATTLPKSADVDDQSDRKTSGTSAPQKVSTRSGLEARSLSCQTIPEDGGSATLGLNSKVTVNAGGTERSRSDSDNNLPFGEDSSIKSGTLADRTKKILKKTVTGLSQRSSVISSSRSDSGSGDPKDYKRSGSMESGSDMAVSEKSPRHLKKSQTGLSAISFATWKSDSTLGTEHKRESRRNLSTVRSKMLDQAAGPREIQNIDSFVADSLNEGERSIHFSHHDIAVAPHAVNARKGMQPNRVRTAKFTTVTWLPLSLFWQFKRVANVYFLIVAIIVLLLGTKTSPKDWKSKCFPFAGVLLWTALKDLYEDSRRKRDDRIENTSQCQRFDPSYKEFVSMDWQDLLVGDVLFLKSGDTFPADLLFLAAEGCTDAFISTMSLDGETNLKKRRVPSLVSKLTALKPLSAPEVQESGNTLDQAWAKGFLYFFHVSSLTIQLAPPSIALWNVQGRLYSPEIKGDPLPLSEASFLPRGCVLRNTPWALAVVCFIGEETKTRLNSSKPTPKFSQIQNALNKCVWGLLVALLCLCLYSSTLSIIVRDEASMCCSSTSYVIMFLIFLVTFYHVVPLSLYVCFDFLKLFLAWQINQDKLMCDPVTEQFAAARNSDLVEEMGQVTFVLSDKTGTLTANEMTFARCSVDGQDFGDFRVKGSGGVPEGVAKCRSILASSELQEKDKVSHFFKCLALCNAVQVAQDPSGRYSYTGMSPDEVSLVQGAHDVGIIFDGREDSPVCASVVRIKGLASELVRYDILYEIEFNSDRKRMSVLAMKDGEVMCITKGADSIMENLLADKLGQAEKEHLRLFSTMGLRTLVVAYKKITFLDFKEWEREFLNAQGVLDESREARIAEISASIETDLQYVGITAVEDRLQDGVPEAISLIKRANIRLWMLTGDKTETAVDIARSCNLFSDDTTIAYATDCSSSEEAVMALQKAKKDLQSCSSCGVVLDGRTIHEALGNEQCQELILELGFQSQSCVCCRLSPKQKRQLVELVISKSSNTVALAIGDGANDVPMLEGAHIGIGIRGKEGAQAVQVADIAISQFRFLAPLLFCHGRRAYWRTALFLNHYLYKSLALAMGDVIWMHQNDFKGGIAFPEYLSVNYNVFFTSWHIVLVLAFDYRISDALALERPELYRVGPSRHRFNPCVFSLWMAHGVLHGSIVWLIPNLWFGGTYYDKTTSAGKAEDFWLSSCSAFCLVVIVVMLKLLLEVQRPCKPSCVFPTLGALLTLIMILGLLGYTSIGNDFQPNMDKIPAKMLTRSDALVAIILSLGAALALDVIEAGVASVFLRSRSIM